MPESFDYQYSEIGKRPVRLSIGKISSGEAWFVHYIDSPNNYVHYFTNDSSEADAMAKMLIYLAEKQIINPKELSND